ncbi:MAG TPA: hypothetical protein VLE53_02610 [Gemmatimonadaceae bacterium]|nr:hypothetical protein [Gemmatimonadaceae bacterium]
MPSAPRPGLAPPLRNQLQQSATSNQQPATSNQPSMLLSLIDSLRCPNAHDETWLVASVDEWHGSHVARGVLGCPICRAEYPVIEGVIDFTGGADWPVGVQGDESGSSIDHADVIRLAAQLDLREPGGVVLLAGRYAPLAPWLESIVAAQYVVVVGVDERIPRGAETGLRVRAQLPLTAQSVRAAAIDGAAATEVLARETARVLRGGGRLVARASVPLPEGVQELARDEHEWVGAAAGARLAPVPLRRR